MFVISFFSDVANETEPSYVKWQSCSTEKGKVWQIKPVQSPLEATKYSTRKKAEHAIRKTPDFNGDCSLTAVVEEI